MATSPHAGLVDHRSDHGVDPVPGRRSEGGDGRRWQVLRRDHPGADCVLHVVGEISDAVGKTAQHPLGGRRGRIDAPRVGTIPSSTSWVRLSGSETAKHPDALHRVEPLARHVRGESLLTGVPERGVAHVVSQADRLGEILVEPQGRCQRSSHLGHLEGVGDPGDVMVVLGVDEDLGLVLEPSECLGVEDSVPSRWKAVRYGSGSSTARPGARRGTGGGEAEQRLLLLLARGSAGGRGRPWTDRIGEDRRWSLEGPVRGWRAPPRSSPSSRTRSGRGDGRRTRSCPIRRR